MSFHVHIGTKEQEFLWDRIYFRDYLKVNPSVASEYERLKLKLAETYKNTTGRLILKVRRLY
ncbi:GrpB family protein [Alteribacillus bidgolensis]|uniref:GrpB family protein n=1 Tax=Alteribacillus bidgolensis TaxID=930129 RepID=UPI000B845FF6